MLNAKKTLKILTLASALTFSTLTSCNEKTPEITANSDAFFSLNEEKTGIGHTGIYIGNGEFIHSANPQRGVVIDNLNTNSYYSERFVSARRIVNN